MKKLWQSLISLFPKKYRKWTRDEIMEMSLYPLLIALHEKDLMIYSIDKQKNREEIDRLQNLVDYYKQMLAKQIESGNLCVE